MSDIPDTNFHIGDDVVGLEGTAATFALTGILFIPEPSGFDALCRANGPVGGALKRWAKDVQELAKSMAPVDTGELRDSIDIKYGKTDTGITADIGTDVFYGGFQEFGTSRNPPHPYLRPALVAVMSEVESSASFGGYVDEIEGGVTYDGDGPYQDYQSPTIVVSSEGVGE